MPVFSLLTQVLKMEDCSPSQLSAKLDNEGFCWRWSVPNWPKAFSSIYFRQGNLGQG